MFEAVLFDFGGVITTSPFEGFARYEREAALPEGLIRRLNATNPDANAWAQYERSEIDRDEFAVRYEAEAAALGFTIDAGAVFASMRTAVRPAVIHAIDVIKARGLSLGLLTNNIALPDDADSDPRYREMHLIRARFDAIVESAVAGCRKPEPRFYEMACELLDVEPGACVFLDDLGVNLKPARAMGMTTIKVLDGEQALGELSTALGFDLGS